MSLRPPRPSLPGIYIAAIFLLGCASFAVSLWLTPISDPLGLFVVVALTAGAEALAVRLHQEGRVSVSLVGMIVAAVSFGFPGAAIVAAATTLTGWLCFSRREPQKLLFNFGQHNTGAFLTTAALTWLAAPYVHAYAIVGLVAGLLASVILFLTSSLSVSVIMALTSHRPWLAGYRANFPWLLPHHLALGAVGGGIAVGYEFAGVIGIVVFSLPLLVSRYSIKQVIDQTRESVSRLEMSNLRLEVANVQVRGMSEELRVAYTGTLESLVTALDVRDQETKGHSMRVAMHSLDLAKLLGICEDEALETIYRGALMHDVGKIGVRDDILLKPGKLTEEEWVFMRKHSEMGYEILAQVPYLRPTARIVLAHHERWDGAGYPRQLKGESIPLGARIFAICDTYDAIISDRPYRAGQTPEAALTEILRCAGSQFDPKVIEAFEAAFPRWRGEAHDEAETTKKLFLPAWHLDDDEELRLAS
ncbi:MAG: HD-GYP domain-containing protein [Dehalococcoidia bacterium]